MRPLDEQSAFSYCEKCGIVYALKDRLAEYRDTGGQERPGTGFFGRQKETSRQKRADFHDKEVSHEAPTFHWRCPDCDAEFNADSDTDLEFAKREHIREYHPNRPAS